MEITYQISDIHSIAEAVIKHASSRTILFYGEMGVGKTTLIKAIVEHLGSNDLVSSPTFSLVNEYSSPSDTIFHFDFYRIENEEEALNFGIEDYFYSSAWKFVEWPEKIPNLIPDDAEIITIVSDENGKRTLKFDQNIKLTKKKPMEQQNFL